MNKSIAIALGVALATFAWPTDPTPKGKSAPLFTSTEKAQVLAYWSKSGRYDVAPPSDVMERGLWQVRLTTAGSIWLREYNRKRGVTAPPTQNAEPANDQQRVWEQWVAAKIAWDRWQAFQQARRSNAFVLKIEAPKIDKSIPESEPANPGEAPADLVTLVGNPPPFAEIVTPMQHTVAFDDVTLTYRDNVRLSNPRYPYYRFEKGVNSEGISMAKMPKDQIARLFAAAKFGPRESRVMRAVSELEGGFDSINTYDTGYVSVGFIQFATLKDGGASLGAFLAFYKQSDPDNFDRDLRAFGIDVSADSRLAVLDLSTGADLMGADACMRTIADPRLIAIFQRAGLKSDAYNAAQIRSAKAQFWPEDDPIAIKLASGAEIAGKVSDFIKSEAGLATLMDRKVNTGNIRKLADVLLDMAATVKPSKMADYAPFELEIIHKMQYRRDFLKDPELSKPGETGPRPGSPAYVVPPASRAGASTGGGGAAPRTGRNRNRKGG